MIEERYTLPISDSHDEIIETIQNHPVTLIRGETGSGKTTQVPQYLLDHYIQQGRGAECNIIVTQVTRSGGGGGGEGVSGKTTQVPQYLLDHYIQQGRGAECNIIVTQVTLCNRSGGGGGGGVKW